MTPKSRLTTGLVAGAAFVMLGAAFAAKPLYDTFCRVTGFGGTTRVAEAAAKRVLDRTVRVRFDANVDPGAPLTFKPAEGHVEVKLGETMLSFYEVTNTSSEPVRAMASYNVVPHKAGRYFNKLECFCFEEMVFEPGVTQRLPVIFFVSPDMDDDKFADDVKGITLSYTYYEAGKIEPSAWLEGAAAVN